MRLQRGIEDEKVKRTIKVRLKRGITEVRVILKRNRGRDCKQD